MEQVKNFLTLMLVPLALAVIVSIPNLVGVWVQGLLSVLVGFIAALMASGISAWLASRDLVPLRRFAGLFKVTNGTPYIEDPDGTSHDL